MARVKYSAWDAAAIHDRRGALDFALDAVLLKIDWYNYNDREIARFESKLDDIKRGKPSEWLHDDADRLSHAREHRDDAEKGAIRHASLMLLPPLLVTLLWRLVMWIGAGFLRDQDRDRDRARPMREDKPPGATNA